MLWRIEGKDGHGDSYLFGTSHGDGNDYELSDLYAAFPALRQALEECEVIAFESRNDLQDSAVLADWAGVAELVLNDHYQNPPLRPRRTPRHWLEGRSVDRCLMKYAAKHGKDSLGLETHTEEMAIRLAVWRDSILWALYEKEQIGYNPLPDSALSAMMRRHYLNNRLDSLVSFLFETEGFSLMDTAWTARRNALWVPRILREISARPCLVAVGAMHLHGPHGLLALLRRRGYRLQPL